jgi:hypothetical protein
MNSFHDIEVFSVETVDSSLHRKKLRFIKEARCRSFLLRLDAPETAVRVHIRVFYEIGQSPVVDTRNSVSSSLVGMLATRQESWISP